MDGLAPVSALFFLNSDYGFEAVVSRASRADFSFSTCFVCHVELRLATVEICIHAVNQLFIFHSLFLSALPSSAPVGRFRWTGLAARFGLCYVTEQFFQLTEALVVPIGTVALKLCAGKEAVADVDLPAVAPQAVKSD